MMKRTAFAATALASAVALSFVLTGCGHSDSANAPASADNVEMPAEEAMSGVTAAPAPDSAASGQDANAASTSAADAGTRRAGSAQSAASDASSR